MHRAGRWRMLPQAKAPRAEGVASELPRKDDVISLQVVRAAECEGEVTIVRINGERMHLRIIGRGRDRRLPGAEMTVGELLALCSDGQKPGVE